MKYVLLVILLGLISCDKPIDNKYVTENRWSWNGGFRIGEGDFITFDIQPVMFEIKKDTIYYRGKPRALIIKMSSDSMFITVSSIDHKIEGEYRNEEASFR
jgi:hypothetical protein